MIDLPKSTLFNKRIGKQKFYENLGASSKLEKQFSKEVESIFWKYKLSPETINMDPGKYVSEIEVFEIILKEQNISKNILEIIDREIPYYLVFILKYKNLGQIWVGYKEASKNREGKFKVDSYYKTDWQEYNELYLIIEGLNFDRVYENFILQVADGKLNIKSGSDIKEAINIAKEKEKIEAYIKNLESKIKNEKQYNRQVELMGELRKIKNELEMMMK